MNSFEIANDTFFWGSFFSMVYRIFGIGAGAYIARLGYLVAVGPSTPAKEQKEQARYVTKYGEFSTTVPGSLFCLVGGAVILFSAVLAPGELRAPRIADYEPSTAWEPEVSAYSVTGGSVVSHVSELADNNHTRLGVPMDPNCEAFKILENEGYMVGFSVDTRTPHWTSYYLFRTDNQAPPRPPGFRRDTRTGVSITHRHYNNTGYDRGHMAPNAAIGACYGAEAQRETFLTSNVCPQVPGLNQRCWQAFEQKVFTDYARNFNEVWVYTGPIFEDPCREIAAGVRIPVAFYKIVVAEIEGEWDSIAIIMNNVHTDDSPISDYLTSIDNIEQRTDLDFLSELEDQLEDDIEADDTASAWDPTWVLVPTFEGRAREINDQNCE